MGIVAEGTEDQKVTATYTLENKNGEVKSEYSSSSS